MSGRFDALWRFGRAVTAFDETSPAGRTFRGFLEPMDRRSSTEKIRTKAGFAPKEKFRLFAEPGEAFSAGEETRLVCGGEEFRLLRAKAAEFDQVAVEIADPAKPDGPRLRAQPVREVASLHGPSHRFADVRLPGANPLAGLAGDLFDIEAEFTLQGASQVGFHVRGIPVTYHVGNQQLACLGCTAPLALSGDTLTLRLIVDRASIEIFGGEGEAYMPVGIIPSDSLHGLEVFVRGGQATVSLTVHELKPIWH